MKKPIKYALILLGLYLIISSVVAGGRYLAGDPPTGTEETTKPVLPSFVQDPTVAARMAQLGLDYSKLNLYHTDNADLPDNHDASFKYPDSIYLSPQINPDNIDVALSHEYIHYIQTFDPNTEKFGPYMDELLAKDTWFYKRMVNYRKPGFCGSDCNIQHEAEAIACTEIPDYVLTLEFTAWCNLYLPHRSTLL